MASEELRKFRLQRAKDFAARHRSRSSATISPDELAAIKKKADDLDAIQKSVSEAAAVGAPLWLSYIFLLFYVAIATGGVTHTQLLLESPVDLPFLNIKLPLKAFFVLAPILFLIVHAYVLAHFAMLSDKAKAFHDRLTAKITADVENDHAIREGLRQQLPINVFVQFLAGPTVIRESGFGVMLWVIAWTTLVGAPVAVLLLLQLQFLPYHDTRVTWLHRVVLCADLGVIWWLWMKILAGRDRSCPKHQSRWMKGWDDFLWFFRRFGAQFATALVVIFSVFIATFPSEWEDWPLRLPQKLERRITTATEFIFGKVDVLNDDESKRVTGNWPVNTLRLREFDVYAAAGVEGPEKLNWKPYTLTLKNRRLERADLRDARLDNIDLRGARLDGAYLDRAKLEKADLEEAWLPSGSLKEAQIRGSSLERAQLQGASLEMTDLREVSLNWAQLEKAWLPGAQLQGAELEGTILRGAVLAKVRLQGASLIGAALQGANLNGAQLQGALLCETRLQGASLDQAKFGGASLNGAYLQGAFLDWVDFSGALLDGAQLHGAVLTHAHLFGASLIAAELQGASLEKAVLEGASFTGAYLWRALLDAGIEDRDQFAEVKREPVYSVGLWRDENWTPRAYDKLRKMIESLPDGPARAGALERISSLDCNETGEDLPPCNSGETARDKPLRTVQPDQTIKAKELADLLRGLVCDPDADAVYVLRGLARSFFIGASATTGLIEFLV